MSAMDRGDKLLADQDALAEIRACFPEGFLLTEEKLLGSPEETGRALDFLETRLETRQAALRKRLQSASQAGGAGSRAAFSCDPAFSSGYVPRVDAPGSTTDRAAQRLGADGHREELQAHGQKVAAARAEWDALQANAGPGLGLLTERVAALVAKDEKLTSELSMWVELDGIMGALAPLSEALAAVETAIEAGPAKLTAAAAAVADVHRRLHGNEQLTRLLDSRVRCANSFVALAAAKRAAVSRCVPRSEWRAPASISELYTPIPELDPG